MLDYLLGRKAAGEIEVGFSYPIVWELLQEYQAPYEADRLDRARCIHLLCDENAYRFFPRDGDDVFSKNGHWYPGPRRLFGISDIADGLFAEIAARAPNREYRRRLCNPTFRKIFVQRHSAALDVRRIELDGFILPAGFLEQNVFYRYLAGQMRETEADESLLAIMTDLTVFTRLWYSYMHKENPITTSVAKTMTHIRNSILRLKDSYEAVLKLRRDYTDLKQDWKVPFRDAPNLRFHMIESTPAETNGYGSYQMVTLKT